MNDVSFKSPYSKQNVLKRVIWQLIWNIFARPFPRKSFRRWKIFLLNLFGAKINHTATVYSSAKIFMPWNLEMDEYSCIASDVDCYNAACVKIGKYATVSQYTYLCTASHDIQSKSHILFSKPITLNDFSWVAASAFVGPGVTIGTGAVVGATASVFKDVEDWTVVGGNPAKSIKKRVITKP
jgi:putative colanic acid biosynthesis acetyltransferase WcaF